MAERRRNRKRQAETEADSQDVPQLEYTIARFLKSNLPPKKATLLGHKVEYFIASRAIDLLLESKWARADKRTDEVKFPNRESVIDFMDNMLHHKFFHRAKTIIVKKEIKQKDTDSTDESHDTKKSKTSATESPEAKKTKKKEKKKVKFDIHPEQLFVDGNEVFVWVYDFIPLKTWLIGGGLVIAAIAICLFPLWPRTVRNYVYYLSIAAAAFLFFIIALAVLKMSLFALVWLVTLGRHHFWILPNLTEDVGFLESFWPLYKHESKSKDSEQVAKPEDDDEKGKNEKDDADKNDSEAESVATTESAARSANGFEILDTNDCNDE